MRFFVDLIELGLDRFELLLRVGHVEGRDGVPQGVPFNAVVVCWAVFSSSLLWAIMSCKSLIFFDSSLSLLQSLLLAAGHPRL